MIKNADCLYLNIISSEKILLMILVDLLRQESRLVTISAIMKVSGFGRKTVVASLANLESMDFIAIERINAKTLSYKINEPAIIETARRCRIKSGYNQILFSGYQIEVALEENNSSSKLSSHSINS